MISEHFEESGHSPPESALNGHQKDQTLLVRPAQVTELEQIIRIEAICGLRHWGRENLLGLMSENDGVLLVAAWHQEEKQTVASIIPLPADVCGFLYGRVAVDEFEIYNIGILPQVRKKGIGASLLTAGLRVAFTRGAMTSFIEVRVTNKSALEFYLRQGFVICGRRNLYYQDPLEDAVVMKRTISALPEKHS